MSRRRMGHKFAAGYYGEGSGRMYKEERRVPCGFREPPKGNSSKKKSKNGTRLNGWEVGR